MPKQFTLKCGVTLEYEHVPTLYAQAMAHSKHPEPNKPTRKIEVGKNPDGSPIYDEREYESPEYRRQLAHYYDYVWPIVSRMALIDVAVLDESVPPVDETLLAARQRRIPDELRYNKKCDWIALCLLASTSGDESELSRLTGAILENDFTFAEVDAAARAMKSSS
jgi:hypothetical protein